MARVSTIAPSRFRKVLFTAIVALVLAACLELGSTIVLYAFSGKLYAPGAARIERESVRRYAQQRSNHATSLPEEPEVTPVPGEEGADRAPEVVHPFLGFVRDPTFEGGRFKLNALGFFDSAPPPGPASDRLTVGIFGGSVAVGLSRSRRLVSELKASPALRGRQIWVRSFALGGYKQPQQLIALNYALAVGEELDVVVNLDGFNDVALAPGEHRTTGLYPVYPRRWSRRVSRLPNAFSQRLIGEIAYLEARRAARAGWCSRPPLSLSPTCHLGWKALDSRTASRLTSLRQALSKQTSDQRQYATLGPRVEYATDEAMLRQLAELWRRSSLQMHQLCAAQGIAYLHFLQPNQYFPDSKKLSRAERRQAFDPEHRWTEIIPAGYPYLARAGEQLAGSGVSFHDLRMVFAGVEDTLYVDKCCHFNTRGMDLVATAVARAIIRDLEADR